MARSLLSRFPRRAAGGRRWRWWAVPVLLGAALLGVAALLPTDDSARVVRAAGILALLAGGVWVATAAFDRALNPGGGGAGESEWIGRWDEY